jgi:hypothetical protein
MSRLSRGGGVFRSGWKGGRTTDNKSIVSALRTPHGLTRRPWHSRYSTRPYCRRLLSTWSRAWSLCCMARYRAYLVGVAVPILLSRDLHPLTPEVIPVRWLG